MADIQSNSSSFLLFKGKRHCIEYLPRELRAVYLSKVYCMEQLLTNNTGIIPCIACRAFTVRQKKSGGKCQTKAKNNSELLGSGVQQLSGAKMEVQHELMLCLENDCSSFQRAKCMASI